MRRFVIRVLLFAVLIVVLFGGWSGAILWLELTSYAREAELPADTAYAVCSDSQTEVSLLPALWPRFFNFSLSATQLDQYELKALDLLERNPGRLQAVIIDISPRKFFAQDIDTPLVEHRSAGKRFLLHALHPHESRRSMTGIPVLFRDSILVKRSAKAWKAFRKGRPYASSIGGRGAVGVAKTEDEVAANRQRILAGSAKCGFRDHLAEVRAGIEEHASELNAWGPVDENSKSVKCIKDILALVKAHGVAPVLITTPYHPEFLAKIPREKLENFRGMMNRISQERGVAWFDYLEMTFTDDEWRDGNHLNVHGSVRLTECVRRDVETAVGVGVAR